MQMPAEMALASSISSKPVPPRSKKVSAAGVEVNQSKLDLFCKLGYGKQDICKVLENLGPEALEDDVLRELIRVGSKPQALENQAQPSPLKLVARGSCSAAPGLKRPGEDESDSSDSLRPIVIDGSNVAMSHGNKLVFSCWGIQLAVDWFRQRGHTYIKVFVPLWRKEPPRQDSPIAEGTWNPRGRGFFFRKKEMYQQKSLEGSETQFVWEYICRICASSLVSADEAPGDLPFCRPGTHILEELEKQSILVYTPSRKVKGKRVVCYDDRYIVKVAYEKDGVIVSNDHYRDLQNENPEWKWFIEQRLLMYSFVSNRFMPPDDPLGRHGPTLDNFLSKKPVLPEKKLQPCPYGKKCTYGNKCKFYHPERLRQAQLSVADELRAKTKVLLTLGKEEDRWNCSPYKTRGEPAPCEACTETLQEARGCSGPSSCSGRRQRSCPEQISSAWAGGPGSDLGLDQRLLQPEALRDQPLLEQMSAMAIGDGTYSCNWSLQTSQDREVTDNPHHCGDLRHKLFSLHHPRGLDRACSPGRPFQQTALPPAPGGMRPEHGWPRERRGRHGTGQGSCCVPHGAQHKQALATQEPLLLQPTVLPPDMLHLYSEHQLQQHQQQHCSPSQPPRPAPFLSGSSNRPGFFQEARAYPSASYSDYWPTPAERPCSARQVNTHRELCSLFPYSEMNQVMTPHPDVKRTGAPPL